MRICLRSLPIGGVDDVTKPVRERVRMRAVEIDDVAAIDYISAVVAAGGGSTQCRRRGVVVGSRSLSLSVSLGLPPATDGVVCDEVIGTGPPSPDHPCRAGHEDRSGDRWFPHRTCPFSCLSSSWSRLLPAAAAAAAVASSVIVVSS